MVGIVSEDTEYCLLIDLAFLHFRAALEHEQVAGIDWSEWRVLALLGAFTLTLFAYYVAVPNVMKVTSATAVNLSLLSADFYALIIGVLLFQFKVGLTKTLLSLNHKDPRNPITASSMQ